MNTRLLFLGFALLSVTACSNDVKSSLGMRKNAPDEFVVISNPPLKEPPEFNLVSPPCGQIPDMQEQGIIQENSHSNLNQSDRLFLEHLGTSSHSSTKSMVDSEHRAKQQEHESKGGVSKALSKLRGDNEDHVIDPAAERARIKENAETGKPINEGKVKNKSKSTLDKLWDN